LCQRILFRMFYVDPHVNCVKLISAVINMFYERFSFKLMSAYNSSVK